MQLFRALIALVAAALLPAAGAAGTLALTNARLIDGTGKPPRDNQTIVVENGRIAAIHDGGSSSLPAAARVIDLRGLTLMPGLIDSHVHFLPSKYRPEGVPVDLAEVARQREADLPLLLRSGVTAVRELAGDARTARDLQHRQASGKIEAPAIRFAAVFFGPQFFKDRRSRTSAWGLEPGTAPWSKVVTPELDVPRAMREAKATGATGVKLYASLTADQLAALSREARRQGLLVWTHSVVFPTGTREVLAAGTDTLVHSKGMVTIAGLDGIPDNYDEGTRLWMASRPYAEIDPDGPAFRAAYAEMVRQGTILEPALMADGERARQPLPPNRAALRAWACRATGAAHRAGVAIAAGTDTSDFEPFELQRELALLVRCGLTPLEAIRAATQTNARALGMADTHGTVEVGKAADLIAVAGDPIADISATKNVRLVIQAGRIVSLPTERRPGFGANARFPPKADMRPDPARDPLGRRLNTHALACERTVFLRASPAMAEQVDQAADSLGGEALDSWWMPFTANRQFKSSPRLFVRAQGTRYFTDDGRAVLDGAAGLWCVNAGHGRREIADAVHQAMSVLDYAPPFQMGHPLAFRAAERLRQVLPRGFESLFFVNSGSEAADTALKIARAYHVARGEPERVWLVGRERGYHGVNFGGISVGGIPANRAAFGPLLREVDHLRHTHDPARNAFSRGQPEHGAEFADDLLRIIAERGAERIAAVMIEPMAGSTGVLPPPVGYLERLRELCSAHGILLIFDEVITGFGRLGASFAAERFGVAPDILTMAKGLTNGAVPMGAVAVTGAIRDALMQGPPAAIELYHGYTYSGHPAASAALIATMDIYEREQLFRRAADLEGFWCDAVHRLRQARNVIDVRNIGLVGAVELAPLDGRPGARGYDVLCRAFAAGLLVRVTGDTIALSPPLVISEDEIDELVEKLAGAIASAC